MRAEPFTLLIACTHRIAAAYGLSLDSCLVAQDSVFNSGGQQQPSAAKKAEGAAANVGGGVWPGNGGLTRRQRLKQLRRRLLLMRLHADVWVGSSLPMKKQRHGSLRACAAGQPAVRAYGKTMCYSMLLLILVCKINMTGLQLECMAVCYRDAAHPPCLQPSPPQGTRPRGSCRCTAVSFRFHALSRELASGRFW